LELLYLWRLDIHSYDAFVGSGRVFATQNDHIYLTTTPDNLVSFSAHAMIINNGQYVEANNPSVVKVSNSDWRMTYTAGMINNMNNPCYSTSQDGGNWNPNTANSSDLIKMNGYANWSNANVNGGNVIFKDTNGLWHLYFVDFNNPVAVLHATSTDFVNYSYQGLL
jgi:hypothetical protein